MARKTFLNGYPLPASDLNTYLMDQTVQTYADATARTAALPTPVEGQMSYLADQNTAYVYDGSSWNAVVDAKNYGATLPNGAAGRNKILNSDFSIWQRGTSFSSSPTFTADRWTSEYSSATGLTISQQTFTPGSAPVAGYENQYFLRYAAGTAAATHGIVQRIEDVRTMAGQTVTISFWAKAAATTTLLVIPSQFFGTGGSSQTDATSFTPTLTTSWARYSYTVTIPSVSGKTIGAGSYLALRILNITNAVFTMDIWGVQLEAGSVATPFATASGTKQGELAACQRYYVRYTANGAYSSYAQGIGESTTKVQFNINLPVQMRSAAIAVEYSTICAYDTLSILNITALGLNFTSDKIANVTATVASATQYRPYFLFSNNSTSGYVGISAEL